MGLQHLILEMSLVRVVCWFNQFIPVMVK